MESNTPTPSEVMAHQTRPPGDRFLIWVAIGGSIALGVLAAVTDARAELILLLLATLALLLAWPTGAYLLMIWILPLDIHVRTSLPIDAIFDPLRYVVGLVVLVRLLGRSGGRLRAFIAAIAAYVVAVALSLIWAALHPSLGLPFEALRNVYRFGAQLIFVMAGLLVLHDRRRLTQVYVGLMIGLVISDLYSFYQYAIHDWGSLYRLSFPDTTLDWADRPSGLLNYANSEGAYINLLLPALLAVVVLGRGTWLRLASGVAACLSIGALGLSQSRGAWLAAFVMVVLLAARLAPPMLRIPIVSLTAVGLAATVVALPFTSSRIFDLNYYIIESRFGVWRAAQDLFLTSPLFGVGYGSFQVRYAAFLQVPFFFGSPQIAAHNLYLQLLAETGLLGAAAFLGLVAFALKRGYRLHVEAMSKDDRFIAAVALGFCLALVGVLVHGLDDVVFLPSPPFATLFWLQIGILTVVLPALTRSDGQAASR